MENLYLVQYDFDADYIEQYVMHPKGGGGLFVETHPFPHVFTPLAKECSGALILGINNKDGSFTFAAFQIPFGYTMKIAANVIHGDSFFVGPYAIALTDTELADSVLFKQEVPDRAIQYVTQTPTKDFGLPVLAEYRLAKAINHLLLIDKIKHEGPKALGVGFFRALPPDVLMNVNKVSDDAQKAFDERFGMVPYSPAGSKGGP